MSIPPDSPLAGDDLQFATVEPSSGAPATPSIQPRRMRATITSTYFALGDKLFADLPPANRGTAAWKPSQTRRQGDTDGTGAGLVGAVIWFAIRRIAHLEIGLVAIVLGFFVGKAVRKGSGNRGGRGYQVLAVLLTYCCIAANYMPDVLEGGSRLATSIKQPMPRRRQAATTAPRTRRRKNQSGGPRFVPALALVVVAALVFVFSLTVPFLPGAENIIGLLIIGFALWEAWKLNARRLLPISCPYQLGPATSSPLLASTVAIANAAPPVDPNVAGGQ